jgi:predicted Ser/Thr protein kinase
MRWTVFGAPSHPGPARKLLVLLALVAACFGGGCSGPEGQVLGRWTFHTRDRSHPIEFPVHLNDQLPNQIETYRLTAEVTLDGALRGRDLDLAIPYLPAQIALKVDGKLVPPAHGSEPPRRHVGPHRWTIPPGAVHADRLSLELEVLHSWTQSAWLDVAPRLVVTGTVTPAMERNRLLNDRGGWFGLIGLSQMGLTFLAIFFWDRQRRAYLWFAIQALAASYYPAHVLGLTTWLGPKLETLFLAQSLSVATIISVYYTHEFFGRGKPHRLWLALFAIAMAMPLPAILRSFIDSTYGTPGVIVCVAGTIVYQVSTGTRLVRTYADRGIGIFFLCCWLALGGAAWVDLWAWVGGGEILDGARPACIGLGLFGIFQSMLLSRSHFRSLEEADRLNVTLRGRLHDIEERQAEVEALNEELRQQVGRRSAHILAALTQTDHAGASSAPGFEPGEVVEGRYRVIAALDSGGMGTVYEVERLHDRRRLALKVAHERRETALARLAREAQIATKVRHPNLVAVVDTDVAQAGYVYLVMELVEGRSLATFEGKHDVEWCVRVLIQILEGVRALHAQGIIHRDLKPANVLLSGDLERDPRVKITDFGISRGPAETDDTPHSTQRPSQSAEAPTLSLLPDESPTRDASDTDHMPVPVRPPHITASPPQLTRTGAISGTPSYIAPELARGSASLTPAVDVFSFGVVAYRLLTGAAPHAEAPFLACLEQRTPKPHTPLAIPRLPERVARLIDACLAFSPAERPGTGELIGALQDALEKTNPDLPSASAT